MVKRVSGVYRGVDVNKNEVKRDAISTQGITTPQPNEDRLYGTRDDIKRSGQLNTNKNNLLHHATKDVMIVRGTFLGSTTVTTTVSEQKTPRQLPLENSWKRAMKRR